MTLPNDTQADLGIFAISVAAGLIGALAGVGGGILVIPALTIGFGVDIHLAIGASIVSVIATSSGAAAAYVRDRMTDMRVGMFLELATTTAQCAAPSSRPSWRPAFSMCCSEWSCSAPRHPGIANGRGNAAHGFDVGSGHSPAPRVLIPGPQARTRSPLLGSAHPAGVRPHVDRWSCLGAARHRSGVLKSSRWTGQCGCR